MESSKSNLLQEDRLASVRRRNKTLIVILFSLIISVALVIGGIVVSLVFQYNSSSRNPNPAVEQFCSVAESELNCTASLSSSIRTTRFSDPTRVYVLSVQSAIEKLSHVDSVIIRSNSRDNLLIDSALELCSWSLRSASDQISGALTADAEVEAMRDHTIVLIQKAIEALRTCGEDLEKVAGSTAVDEARVRVQDIEVLLRNSINYLVNFDWVNNNFQANDKWSMKAILDNVAVVSLFGVQYFVLIFLFCLLTRK